MASGRSRIAYIVCRIAQYASRTTQHVFLGLCWTKVQKTVRIHND